MGRTVLVSGYESLCEACLVGDPDVSAETGLSLNTLSKVRRGGRVNIATARKIHRFFEQRPISPVARKLLGIEKDEAAMGSGE